MDIRAKLGPGDYILEGSPLRIEVAKPIIITPRDNRIELNAGGRSSKEVEEILLAALKLLWQQESMSIGRL